MKKTWIALIALVMILALACTACGGSKDEPAAAATSAPAATEIPRVSPGAVAGASEETGLAGDDNKAPDKRESNREEWLASLSEEQRLVEETLVGHPVEDLYAAIGQPKNVTYSASCMVANGQDGILEYDGFFVSTTKPDGGTELVMGTEN